MNEINHLWVSLYTVFPKHIFSFRQNNITRRRWLPPHGKHFGRLHKYPCHVSLSRAHSQSCSFSFFLWLSLSHTHSITVFPSLCHPLSLFAVIKGATPSSSERHIHRRILSPLSVFLFHSSICVYVCVRVCVCVCGCVSVIVFYTSRNVRSNERYMCFSLSSLRLGGRFTVLSHVMTWVEWSRKAVDPGCDETSLLWPRCLEGSRVDTRPADIRSRCARRTESKIWIEFTQGLFNVWFRWGY